jgi:peroxiredoxin
MIPPRAAFARKGEPASMKPNRSLLTLMLVGSLALLSSSSSTMAAVTTGAAAPAFTLTDLDGKKHSLKDFKGKVVVLEWFNHQCPFVEKHYKSGNMQKIQADYTKKGVVWLAVNSTAKGKDGHFKNNAEGKKVLTDWKANATAMLVDADGKVGKAYGAKTTPHMYVINGTGTLVYQGAIDSKASTDPADIESSTNYVVQALDATLAGKPVTTGSTDPYGCSVKY